MEIRAGERPAPLVLIVEQHDDSREMYSLFLLASGLRVTEASNAHDALERFTAFRPDVVISELDLPGDLDGSGLCTRVKALGNPPPVIILTAWTAERRLCAAVSAGCDRLLVKPCLPNVLLDEILVLLDRSGDPQPQTQLNSATLSRG